MKLALVQFESTDKLQLPGLLYTPEAKTNRVALCLHGNGSSSVFYSQKSNVLGEALTKKGIAYLAFNNRGAHYVKSLDREVDGVSERVMMGMAYEKIEDCVQDIDGAIEYLKKQGYTEFYVLGFSTGANKICVYEYLKPENEVSKYVLLGGGDDTGIFYDALSHEDFKDLLAESKAMTNMGRGMEFVDPERIMGMMMTHQAVYDTINPDGLYNCFPFYELIHDSKLSTQELFREFKAIKKPALVMYGSEDEYCWEDVPGMVDILKNQVQDRNNFEFEIVDGADHGFSNKVDEMAERVAEWLS